jgi:alpha-1,2-mannosyltransferase
VPSRHSHPQPLVQRLQALLDWTDGLSQRRLALAVFLPLLAIYVATGNVNQQLQSPDPIAAALPAWHWVNFHTLHLDGVRVVNPWEYFVNGHIATNRTMGVVLFGIPFYELLGHSTHFSMFPAVVGASAAAAGAVTFLVLVARTLTSTRLALLVGAVFGLGTATWSVSADTMWPHGPDQLFLAAGTYFLSTNKRITSAVAFALAIPVRAHLAVVPLIAGLWLTLRERALRPLIVFGAPSTLALALVSLYNHWMFGTWSLEGGYWYVASGLSDVTDLTGHTGIFKNLLGTFFSLDRGLVIWCPLAILLCIGLRAAWRNAPDWVRLAACGGVAYMAVQLKINYFSGGDRFWSYRLSLEMLTLAAPLLTLACHHLLTQRPRLKPLLCAAAVYGIAMQAVGAIFYRPGIDHHSAWTHSKLAQELVHGGLGPRIVTAAGLAAVVASLAFVRGRQARPTG